MDYRGEGFTLLQKKPISRGDWLLYFYGNPTLSRKIESKSTSFLSIGPTSMKLTKMFKHV